MKNFASSSSGNRLDRMTRGHRTTFRRLAKVAALARGARGKRKYTRRVAARPASSKTDAARPGGSRKRRNTRGALLACSRGSSSTPRRDLRRAAGESQPSTRNPCSPQPQVCPDPNHHLPVSDPKGRASCPTLRSGHRIPTLTLPYHFFHSIPAFSERIE